MIGYDDTKYIDIENLGERKLLLQHFAIDAVDGLFTPINISMNACSRERAANGFQGLSHDFSAVATGGQNGLFQDFEPVWIEIGEGGVLELTIHRVQAQSMGDRRI